ncbi:NERD domain-containing protein [Niabella sp. 22666]|uniref:NERD domain-containing protein n=1 Tax=Niabella sp. 22666 TaxID=3453954 RepID=UPI003F87A506
MCIVYNTIGSLTHVKYHLHQHHINEFNSLKEVIHFRDSYASYKKQLISDHELLIRQEADQLSTEVPRLQQQVDQERETIIRQLNSEIENHKQQLAQLTATPAKSIIQQITNYLKLQYLLHRISKLERSFNKKVTRSIHAAVELWEEKNNRYQFITNHFSEAVNESCAIPLKELDRKKSVIDEVNSAIYGALGEQKVVNELKYLTDDYFLINDFSMFFSAPVYHPKENEYINSIQIDHILIGPSGVFLIETKNWSEKSLNDYSLFSPVQQIKRTSYILFRILNNESINAELNLSCHHWGKRKIPIKNLIVFTNSKPIDEFQYVKTLRLSELIGYVEYFEPIFTPRETTSIKDYLLGFIDYK